ncbi:MAG: hypothetical protein Q8K28_02500 [Hoeflea sp.]|uniref:hypothetical protein n=1 Tax=Hoeflea sp. TaxID=1940281 RepID=UPI00272F7900|nr:hypothetical protein [Hoeflea sp.]MDP2118754.1 hypothetical protein [Hoeflea sp.]
MAYQFVHLDLWSRKADAKGRSTSFIFDEASRKPIACVHVPDPKPSTTLYGVGIEEARQMHDAATAIAATTVKGKPRKIRADQKTLHTVVASHPYTVEEVRGDRAKLAEVREWERLSIAWLREQYGPALKTVIRHTDEKQWHIHAYIIPTADPEMKAMGFHPGTIAKRVVKAAGPRPGEDAKALNKRSDVAYKSAMREWQDSYHDAVAAPCGLTRLGPARRRLSREEWKAEQAQAGALKKALDRAADVETKGQAYIDRTKAAAASLKAEAEAKAARSQGVGGAVRAVVDGIQESRIRDQIRREFAQDISATSAALKKLKAEVAREQDARRNADKSAADARYVSRQQSARLANANQEIRRLSNALTAALDEQTPINGGMVP